MGSSLPNLQLDPQVSETPWHICYIFTSAVCVRYDACSALTEREVLGHDVRTGLVVLQQPNDAHHSIYQLHQEDGYREEGERGRERGREGEREGREEAWFYV